MEWLLSQLTSHVYAKLAGLLLLCGLGLPIPEDISLIAGGYLAHLGTVDLHRIFLVCFLAVLGGDSIAFGLGRGFGSKLLASRFTKTIAFPPYAPNELAAILRVMAKRQNYVLPDDLEPRLDPWIKLGMRNRSWGNAREMRTLLERAREAQASRISLDPAADRLDQVILGLPVGKVNVEERFLTPTRNRNIPVRVLLDGGGACDRPFRLEPHSQAHPALAHVGDHAHRRRVGALGGPEASLT